MTVAAPLQAGMVDHDFERKERWLRENGARYSL
jgi:hypothetical protein